MSEPSTPAAQTKEEKLAAIRSAISPTAAMKEALSVGALKEQWPEDVVAIICIGARCLLRYRISSRNADGTPAAGVFELVRIRTDSNVDEYGAETASQRANAQMRSVQQQQPGEKQETDGENNENTSNDSSVSSLDYEENVSRAPNLLQSEVVASVSSYSLSPSQPLPAFASLHHFRIPLPSAVAAANAGTSAGGSGQEPPAPPPSSTDKNNVTFVEGEKQQQQQGEAEEKNSRSRAATCKTGRLGGVDAVDHSIMNIVRKLLSDRGVSVSDPELVAALTSGAAVPAPGSPSSMSPVDASLNSSGGGSASMNNHTSGGGSGGSSNFLASRDRVLAVAADGNSFAILSVSPPPLKPRKAQPIRVHFFDTIKKDVDRSYVSEEAQRAAERSERTVQEALEDEEAARQARDPPLYLRRTGAFPFAVTACAMFVVSYTDMGGLSDAFRRSGSSAPVVGPLPFPADASMSRCMKELSRMGVMCLRQKHCALCYSSATGNFVVLDMGALSSDDVDVAARAVVATGNLGAGWSSIVWAGPLCRSSQFARGGTSHRPKTMFRIRFFCYSSETGMSGMETVPIPCEALAGAGSQQQQQQQQQQHAGGEGSTTTHGALTPSPSSGSYRSPRLRSRRRSTISKLAPEESDTQLRQAGVVATPFSVSGQRMCILTSVANDTALLPLGSFDESAALYASAAASASSSRMTATSTTQWTRFVEVAGRVSFDGWQQDERAELEAAESSAGESSANESGAEGAADSSATSAAAAALSISSQRRHRHRSKTPEQRRRKPTAVVAQAIMQEKVFTVPELEWSRFVTVHERYSDGGNYDEVLCYSAARGCAWVSRIAYDDRFHVEALAQRLQQDLEEDEREDAMIQDEVDHMIQEGSHSGIFLPLSAGERGGDGSAASGNSGGGGAAAATAGGGGVSPRRERSTTFQDERRRGSGGGGGGGEGDHHHAAGGHGRSRSGSTRRPGWGTGDKASSRSRGMLRGSGGGGGGGPHPPDSPRERFAGGRNRASHFQRVEAEGSKYDQHGRKIDSQHHHHRDGGSSPPRDRYHADGSRGKTSASRRDQQQQQHDGGHFSHPRSSSSGQDHHHHHHHHDGGRDTQLHRPGTSPHRRREDGAGSRGSWGSNQAAGGFYKDEVTGKWVRPQQRSSAFAPLLFPKDKSDRGTTGGLPPRPGTSGHYRHVHERPSSGRASLPRLAEDGGGSDAGGSSSRPGSSYSNDPRRRAARAAAQSVADRVKDGKREPTPLEQSQRRRNKSLAFSLSQIQKLGVGEEGGDESADLTKILSFMKQNQKAASASSTGGAGTAAAQDDDEEDEEEEDEAGDDGEEDAEKKAKRMRKKKRKSSIDVAIYKRAQELIESDTINDEWIAAAFAHIRNTGFEAEKARKNNAVFAIKDEVLPSMSFPVPESEDDRPPDRVPRNRPGWSYVLGSHERLPPPQRLVRAEARQRRRAAKHEREAVFDEEKIEHFYKELHTREAHQEKAFKAIDKQWRRDQVDYDPEKDGPRHEWTQDSLEKFYDQSLHRKKVTMEKLQRERAKDEAKEMSDPRGKQRDKMEGTDYEDMVKRFAEEYPVRVQHNREKLRRDEDKKIAKECFTPERWHPNPNDPKLPNVLMAVKPPPMSRERRQALGERLSTEEQSKRQSNMHLLAAELEEERLKNGDEVSRRVMEGQRHQISPEQVKEMADRLSSPVMREATPISGL